jgi:hypothetical protein
VGERTHYRDDEAAREPVTGFIPLPSIGIRGEI